ncbi:MAG: phytoene desaturase family protein, partial [Planctomycetota bacterium]
MIQSANQATAQGKHIVIVGGGLAGIASAVELASHGFRVTVVEKNNHFGGKLNVFEESGYSFDMGPTIITMPQVFRGIVKRSGRKPEDYAELINLDPQWRCFYEDGAVLDLAAGLDAMIARLNAQFPGTDAADGFTSFVEYARRMFRLSEKVFFYKDLGGIADMMRKPSTDPSVLSDVMAMRLHSTVGHTVHKHIAEPHVQQLCEHFLQYVGSSPFLSPAILSLIASAQVDQGCWYAMGGTRMIGRSLAKIAGEQGTELITGHSVTRIIESGGRATGVELDDGRTITADAVVSNCDVQRTLSGLVGTSGARSAQADVAKKYVPACSGLVLYLGLDRQYDHLAHHNFLFSGDSTAEFDDIYHKGIPARDPTLYIAAPSRTDRTQAPEGGEALYVLIHTAYLRDGHRWETEPGTPGPTLDDYKPVVMDKLRRFGMPDIDEHIVVDRFLTPQGIERMYNAEGGAIYGLASHGKLAGGFKPRNRSKTLRGLYLAGGSVNPGPGMPMVLMSGVTAARSVCEDFGVSTIDSPLPVREDGDTPVTAAATS